MILMGRSGKQYSVNIYSSDVIGAFVTMSANGVAGTGSANFIGAPEDCIIKDISFASSNTVSTNFLVQRNDANVGIIAIATVLTTLNNRAVPNVQFRAGDKIGIVQA